MPEVTTLQDIVPPGAVAAEVRAWRGAGRLFPEEEALLGRATAKRIREFTAGRTCARRALSGLGLPPAAVLHGPQGAPLWPAGVVGSLTHRAGYAAAVVARADRLDGIGIDAEPHAPLPAGLLDRIALPAERDWVGHHTGSLPGVHWDRLLFSAKESVYKACRPLGGRPPGFLDAELTADAGRSSFAVRLSTECGGAGGRLLLDGRWLVGAGMVVTVVSVPRHGSAAGA